MRYTHFEIENYKGVEHARLDMDRAPCGRIHTIVGLNESGKTTVLEAIHLLGFREQLDALELPGYTQKDIHELIPVSKRANFNGRISVTAGVEFDDNDQKLIRKLLQREKISLTEDVGPFKITKYYEFQSSRVKPGHPKFTWTATLKGRVGKRKPATLSGEPWQKAWTVIKSTLPCVVYFPNFLFEFPDKIYLENAPSADEKKNDHYREVLQDVLDAIGNGTNLDQHILVRAKSGEVPDKKSLQTVLLEMSSHITKTVFDAWGKTFHRSNTKTNGSKEIVVSHDQDTVGWYLKLFLKNNNEQYEISERSLGFRWFLAYLLLTQYRGFRSRGAEQDVVFLLDEPASNLHSSAQAQLLDSFGGMQDKCSVIYTTHSQHLINPAWLENAYVVRNEGLHYTDTDDDYSAKRTTITLHRYRDFAVRHPDQTTYFQPILDVLDYSPSRLENIPDIVMLEGKNDYYTLSLLKQFLCKSSTTNFLRVLDLDPLIRLFSFTLHGEEILLFYWTLTRKVKRKNSVTLKIWRGCYESGIYTFGHKPSVEKA